jgi:ABC-2 type transport system permease protein
MVELAAVAFVVDIPPNFQRGRAARPLPRYVGERRRHRHGTDGTRFRLRAADHHQRDRGLLSYSEGAPLSPANLDVRIEFNPNITTAWFTCVRAIIHDVTMLAIILAGAAVIHEHEREHGPWTISRSRRPYRAKSPCRKSGRMAW